MSNFMLLTPLFKGSDVPAKIGMTFATAREQFWLDALPATTTDSCGYKWQLKPHLLGARINC